jgi:hypothetical protein
LSFNKLRKTSANMIRQLEDGELARVHLCHKHTVPTDFLMAKYTDRPFEKLQTAVLRMADLLRREGVFAEL